MATMRVWVEADRMTALAAMAAFERAFAGEGAPVSTYEIVQDGPWIAEALVEAAAPAGDRGPLDRARAALSAAGLSLPVKAEPLEPRDWVREGLLFLKPVRAGRFTLHGSHDAGRLPPSRGNLLVDAGSAFGTGHHATTLGCLLAVDTLCRAWRPETVLDVGTGTGVLAMAAVRAGAPRAVATDVDPVAVATARRNARLNGLSGRIAFVATDALRHRTVAARAPYDLVFANILANPLVALAGEIAGSVAPDGRLVLAGFRSADERRVIGPYLSRGLVRAERGVIDDWPTVVLARPRRRPAARV